MRTRLSLRNTLLLTCLFSAATALTAATPARADGLGEDEFKSLYEQLAPQTHDDWRLLPWHTSIIDAVDQATKQKRPVYMLVRSGHPLGCV